jgi:hypothetical protein
MILITHRINTLKELKKIPPKYGVEIDVREYRGRLILQHEPFVTGEKLEVFLKKFNHKFIIFNVKSERIEFKILHYVKKYKLKKYFFLDSSFPMIKNLINLKEKNIACRVSDEEDIKTALNLKQKVIWIWFETQFPFKKSYPILKKLKKNNFKICIVSPDLHKKKIKFNKNEILFLKKNNLIDAVCVKFKNLKNWI